MSVTRCYDAQANASPDSGLVSPSPQLLAPLALAVHRPADLAPVGVVAGAGAARPLASNRLGR